MSEQNGNYRHRLFDTIVLTSEGKVGINTTHVPTSTSASLVVNGTTASVGVVAQTIEQTPTPMQNS